MSNYYLRHADLYCAWLPTLLFDALAPFGRPSEGEVWGTCEVCDGQHGIAIEGPGWRRSPPITMSRNLLDMRERDRK
jgi:hypothetical protein